MKIFLVGKSDGSIDLDAMGAWAAKEMPKFMVPRYLEIVPEFPKTPATARIQKSSLRVQAPGPHQWDRMAQPKV